jgi:hypothetical protein
MELLRCFRRLDTTASPVPQFNCKRYAIYRLAAGRGTY